MAEIVNMQGEPIEVPPSGPVNKEVIAGLHDLLRRAQRGEIQALAFAYVDAAGEAQSGWDGVEDWLWYPMHAAVAILGSDLVEAMKE